MYINRPLLKEFFSAAAITALLHYFALKMSFYWTTEWYDIMMHFLGGVTIGLGVFFFLFVFHSFDVTHLSRALILYIIVVSTLFVGLGWELWELFVGFTDVYYDAVDTFIDIIMDAIGAACAFIIGKRYLTESQE